MFFDQFLSAKIEINAIYQANKQPLTTNAQDDIFMQEAAISDSIVECSHLSQLVEDGVFAWIAFGIDVKKSTTNTHH